MRWISIVLVNLSLLLWVLVPSQASDFTLKVTGSVEEELQLTLADLDEIGREAIKTTSTWNSTPLVFEGPKVIDILKKAGAKGTKILAVASNNYQVSIPISEFHKFPVIIASREEGKTIPRRRKGPLRLIYPRDQNSDEITINRDSYWVWNLVEIKVEK